MNIREIIKRTEDLLVMQGRPSLAAYKGSDIGKCAYRGDGGAKCAAGVWISDAAYQHWMEGRMVSAIIDKAELPTVEGLRPHDSVQDFWIDLQSLLHDDCSRTGPEFCVAVVRGANEMRRKYGVV